MENSTIAILIFNACFKVSSMIEERGEFVGLSEPVLLPEQVNDVL